MKKTLFTINIDNTIDLITNSSSELFILHEDSLETAKEMIASVYPEYLSEYEEVKSLRDSDKKQIEVMIRKEIKDFIGSNTMRQYEEKILELVSKEIRRGKLENDTKDIVIKVFREFYSFMWTQRGYWEPRLRNA